MNATIYFTKRIDTGALKGLLFHESLTYPTVEACAFWSIGRKVKATRWGPGYTIIDASFQKYDRSK